MDTAIVRRDNGKNFNRFGEEVITCDLCKKRPTIMLGTRRCNWCWELENSIRFQPWLAFKLSVKELWRQW